MARARNIKPGFFRNEDLAECSPWARLCFIGLWCLADREGRLEDRPRRIKGELFPLDTTDVEPLLVQLAERGFIVRYQAGAVRAIQIRNFAKHQSPHHREGPSLILAQDRIESPGPAQVATSAEPEAATPSEATNAPDKPAASPGPAPSKARPSRSDSLNPDSLNPSPPIPPKGLTVHRFPPGFDEFWSAYPKKAAKDEAAKAFAKRKPDAALLDTMLKAISAQKASEQWRKDGGQFIPNPATWLNQGRWQDEVAQPAKADDLWAGAR